MPNRLAREKSPYLQQHAENPVEWYPWGSEPFELARREDKPLLISIGYSSCHWCHVMAHESFENPKTARLMNELFVNIKVDREERPDVDAVYMEAIQAMTGQGGWPLSVFVTPEGKPFFGGTYFPPEGRHGLPSWSDVLVSVASAYRERREEVARSAAGVTEYVQRAQSLTASSDDPTPEVLAAAYATAATQFDWHYGGFGGAPKFPQPLSLNFVLRMYRRLGEVDALRFVETTLQAMAGAGIFDQIGGGFHRYSVDAQWVVPHFEKMLYDNALLVPVYLRVYQVTHDPQYRTVAEETLDYLLREMRSPEGGFYSSQDADSEGEEGKFYVWTPEELFEVLPAEQARAIAIRYGVRPEGNFEGKTILTVRASHSEVARAMDLPADRVGQLLSEARTTLLEARSHRVPPGKDTKIITSWNALAITAFAEAGAILNRKDYLDVARTAASFLLSEVRSEGRVMRSYQNGPSAIPGFLEDHAFLIEALVTLYETAFDGSYLMNARRLAAEMVERFWDGENGAFFDTALAEGELVVRPRGFYDNPIPSGNSSATLGLLRLEALTGETSYTERAVPAFRVARDVMARAPLGFSYLLSALDFHFSTPMQIAISGPPESEGVHAMLREVLNRYLPNKVIAVGATPTSPLLDGRDTRGGEATAYVCRHFACNLPATDAAMLAAQLDEGTL